MLSLTDEQKRKIEENKQKALAKRAEKLGGTTSNTCSSNTKQHNITAPAKPGAAPWIGKPVGTASCFTKKPTLSLNSSTTLSNKVTDSTNLAVSKNIIKNINESSIADVNSKSSVKTFYSSNQTDNGSLKPDSNKQQAPKVPTRTHIAHAHVKAAGAPWIGKTVSSSKGALESASNSSVCSNNANTTAGHNSGTKSVGLFGKTVKGHCVLVAKDRFLVDIGYNAPLVDLFKTLGTKLYDPVSKKWSFHLNEYEKLLSIIKPLHPGVQLEPFPKAITQIFRSYMKGIDYDRSIPDVNLSKRVDKILDESLMPFQREGVMFGIHKKGRVLIADDMGLGKTIQAICLAQYYKDEWPMLVVAPSSVKYDWAQQLQRWLPSLDPQEINIVTTGKDSCTSGLVNILSYDIMARKAELLKNQHFQVVIMDESHNLKNQKTARSKAALPILQNARRVILLSGTPALSRPSELYNQIIAVCPYLFKFHEFGVRYCEGKQMQWGWDYSGSSNMAELQLLLEESIMIRRLKKDVLSQLPAKVRQMVQLDPASIKTNRDLKNASKLLDNVRLKGVERRGALLNYFHETSRAKMTAVRDYLLDLLENDKKFIVFAHHQELLDAIEDTVQENSVKYMRIDGRTSSDQRNQYCKKFQTSDSMKVAILSITAANAGLNLSAASLVVFVELFWNPGILVQAEDRAHRLGQQDCVYVHYLVAPHTADDYIWPLINSKLNVLSKAGLTKDNFSEANMKIMKDSKQTEIMQYFEESFIEDNPDDSFVEEMDNTATSSSYSPVKKKETTTKIDNYFSKESVSSTSGKQESEKKNIQECHDSDCFGDFDADDFSESLTAVSCEDIDWDDDEMDDQPAAKKFKT